MQESTADIKKKLKTAGREEIILNVTWIYYQKAFDSVPHSWIEKSIEPTRVNSELVKFCKLSIGR
jgi:hypothetical protein